MIDENAYRQLIIDFIFSLTTADHLGDILRDTKRVMQIIGLDPAVYENTYKLEDLQEPLQSVYDATYVWDDKWNARG